MALENNIESNAYVSVRRLDRFWGKAKEYINTPRPIIVSNLTTDLEPFTKAGEYHIVMRRYVEQEQYEISLPYILYVQVTPRGTITQILVEPLSHKVRTCVDGVWSEWSEQYIYASKTDIEEAKQWAAIGWVL